MSKRQFISRTTVQKKRKGLFQYKIIDHMGLKSWVTTRELSFGTCQQYPGENKK